MKLKTAELKRFKQFAAMIPQNNIVPILSYLHFKPGSVTKNSLNSFVTMEIDCKEEMLIDEKILMSVVAGAGDEVDVKVKGKHVVLNGSLKDCSPTDDIVNFPALPSSEDTDWMDLPSLALYDIGTCSSLLIDDPNMAARSHVYIKNGVVGGGDGVIVYTNKHEQVPDVILSKFSSAILGKFEEGKLAQSENYQFFETGNILFGFVKPETGMMDFSPFLKMDAGNSFTVDKKDFIAFNDHVSSTMTLPNPSATLEVKNGKLYLDMVDTAYERTISKQIECEGSCDEFTFSVGQMNRLLKTLPDQVLTFTQGHSRLYITGETGFISLIMRVQK